MREQVVKAKHGKMHTLLDSGPVDLRKMGEVSVHRSSHILFDEEKQKFYISFLEPKLGMFNSLYRGFFFPTYGEAVAEEVKTINYARKAGIL